MIKKENQLLKNGVADLTGRYFSENRIIRLDGNWEFYYGEMLEPRDFKSSHRENVSYLAVPGDWDNFVFNGKKIGSWGSSTYRLTILTGSDDPIYFKLMPPNTAYKIWANGVYCGACGKTGKSFREEIPEYKLVIYEFKPVDKKN